MQSELYLIYGEEEIRVDSYNGEKTCILIS